MVSKDLVAFGQLFLPEDFMKSSAAPFHYEVGNKLLDRTLRKLCIVLPRGHSKSTMAKAALLHRIYFNPQGKKRICSLGIGRTRSGSRSFKIYKKSY